VELTQAIADCVPGVPTETLEALVRHESGGNPFAININGAARLTRMPQTRSEARAVLAEAERQQLSIDIGLGQVNGQHLLRFGLEASDLLDACRNLQITALILGECYARTASIRGGDQARLARALSCYNTGDLERGLRRGYVRAVYRAAAASVAPLELPFDALDGWRSLHLRSAPSAPTFDRETMR
jgi:type IV secretion system protein VirB1